MATNAHTVETILMRVQGGFLERPALRLTIPQAERHFQIDRASCEAVLDALVDARVLARSADGSYARFFPPLAEAA